MDKMKIVFIVDDGLPSGGLFDALKAVGEQFHMDVEMIPMPDTLLGTRPKLTIWDEHTVLPDRVFGNLQQIPRTKHHLNKYADALIPGVGADHPSRKGEPKGPRGKWGKL